MINVKDTTMAADQNLQFDVFLSHSGNQMAAAPPLAERLRYAGPKIWPVPTEHPRENGRPGRSGWASCPFDICSATLEPLHV